MSRERPITKNKDMLVSLSAPVEVLPISPDKGPMMTRTEDDERRCCGTSNERSLSCPGHLMSAAKIRSSSQLEGHEKD